MATSSEVLEQYRREQVTMGSPEALTLMLYEAALKSVRKAKGCLGGKPIDVVTEAKMALDVCIELADNVNLEHPHGQRMRDLYLYCWRTLLAAPGRPDAAEQFDAVDTVLTNLVAGLRAYTTGAAKPAAVESNAPVSIDFVG